jgi:hypothetical protein
MIETRRALLSDRPHVRWLAAFERSFVGYQTTTHQVTMQRSSLAFVALCSLALSWFGVLSAGSASGQISTVQQTDRIEFLHDGKLLASYLFRSGTKPVLWPIHGPDGVRMTRNYPLDATIPGEDHDHPHHRGLWMTFGEVNGHDWWAEGKGKGIVAHHKVIELKHSDTSASLIAEHHWLPPTSEKANGIAAAAPVLLETCRYTISQHHGDTVIDCEYLVRSADPAKGVHFGDTKEGMFAVRVPESMRGDKPNGQILNSVGDRQGDTWGKTASWVDYSGPVSHQGTANYGIAILVHPSSFRAQGLWHVRTYGLFAHNPFGIKDFLGNRTKTPSGLMDPPHAGGYELPAGETLHFFYRVCFHRDRWTLDGGNERFAEFSQTTPELHP